MMAGQFFVSARTFQVGEREWLPAWKCGLVIPTPEGTLVWQFVGCLN